MIANVECKFLNIINLEIKEDKYHKRYDTSTCTLDNCTFHLHTDVMARRYKGTFGFALNTAFD